jgi:hypothetical protein
MLFREHLALSPTALRKCHRVAIRAKTSSAHFIIVSAVRDLNQLRSHNLTAQTYDVWRLL